MPTSRYVFEEWGGVVLEVTRCAADAAYLTLEDRTTHSVSEPLGRFDWSTIRDAMPEEDEPGEESFGYDDQAELEPDGRAEQALTWIRSKAEANCVGDARTKLRVRLYAEKGVRQLGSAQFLVRDVTADEDPTVAPMPAMTPQASVDAAAYRGMQDLVQSYREFAQLQVWWTDAVVKQQTGIVRRQGEQLQAKDDQIERVVARSSTSASANRAPRPRPRRTRPGTRWSSPPSTPWGRSPSPSAPAAA